MSTDAVEGCKQTVDNWDEAQDHFEQTIRSKFEQELFSSPTRVQQQGFVKMAPKSFKFASNTLAKQRNDAGLSEPTVNLVEHIPLHHRSSGMTKRPTSSPTKIKTKKVKHTTTSSSKPSAFDSENKDYSTTQSSYMHRRMKQ